MITPENYELYWQHAAERHISIAHTATAKHFATFTVEDVLSNLKNVLSPLVALEDPEFTIDDQLVDNVRLILTGGVLILKKTKQGDSAQARAAIIEMFPVALDMIRKMQNDRKKANDGTNPSPENLLKHLDLKTIRMLPVGPVFDGWNGWRIEFQMNAPANLDLDETKWLPGTETKWTF